jgi:hypothetical protein
VGERPARPRPRGQPRQTRYIPQALYLLWRAGVKVVVNFQLRDPPFDPQNDASADAGLLFSDGSAKPSFEAFRSPLVTEGRGK